MERPLTPRRGLFLGKAIDSIRKYLMVSIPNYGKGTFIMKPTEVILCILFAMLAAPMIAVLSAFVWPL